MSPEMIAELDRLNSRIDVTEEEWDQVYADMPCLDCDVREIEGQLDDMAKAAEEAF